MQERVGKSKLPVKAHEKMRIAGKLVDGEERIEVRNPYTGAVVGTVAAASPAQVAEAFRGLRELAERHVVLRRHVGEARRRVVLAKVVA